MFCAVIHFFEVKPACLQGSSSTLNPEPPVSPSHGEFSDPVYKEIALANGKINRMSRDELRAKLSELKLDTR